MSSDKSAVAKKNKRLKRFFAIVFAAAFAAVCLFTPLFGVSGVSVRGNTVLDSDLVIKASGITEGENMFRINTANAKKNISALGHVEDVKIYRKFPSRIVIEITESEEAAYILFAGNYIGVDTDCKVIGISKSTDEHAKKAVVSGIALKKFEIGQTITAAKVQKEDELKKLFSALKKHKILADVAEINISDSSDINITLESGTKVVFGNADKLDYKVLYLTTVLEKIDNLRGGEIDVSDTENVVYKGGN